MAFRLRLRGPVGKQHTASMPATAVVADLRKEAATIFAIVEAEIEMLLGFPPVVCDANQLDLLDGLVNNGDTVIIRRGTGETATQAMSLKSFSDCRLRAMPKSRAPMLTQATRAAALCNLPLQHPPQHPTPQVNLFWKIDMDDMLHLKNVKLPQHCERLDEVGAPHVCLLFFGGREEAKAAEKVGLPVGEFRRIHRALSARAGNRVTVIVQSICVHVDVVFAVVSLPNDLSHHQGPGILCPYIKLRANSRAPGDVARRVFADGNYKQIALPAPLSVSGTIQLETAPPLHQSQRVREIRLANETQGRWVRVKKHSSMACAVIKFPSCVVRDSVLHQHLGGEPLQIHGITLDVKPHLEKQFDGTRMAMSESESLFVAWLQASGYDQVIRVEDLTLLFDQQVGPLMNTLGLDESALLSDAMLRCKVDSEGAMTSCGDILVLKLTRMARSAEVTSILLSSPALEECRLRMTVAGYDLMPPWGNGARFFVPLVQEDVDGTGVYLQHFHIVAYSSDVERIRQALSTMPCRERPKLVEEQLLLAHEIVVECTLRTHSSFGPMSSSGL